MIKLSFILFIACSGLQFVTAVSLLIVKKNNGKKEMLHMLSGKDYNHHGFLNKP